MDLQQKTEKLLIFDWDGTLFDNLALLYLCISEVFKRHNIEPPTVQEYRHEIGIDFMKFFYDRGLPAHITTDDVQKILKEVKYGYYDDETNPLGIKVREDAIDVLLHCKENGIKTAVISAEVPDVLERGLSLSGVKPLLDHYCGFSFKKGEAILEACNLFGVTPSQTYYVDDLAQGVEEGKKVGVTVFGMLNNGHNSAERILAVEPHFGVNSLMEIVNIVKDLK